jgi:hypothetical protein
MFTGSRRLALVAASAWALTAGAFPAAAQDERALKDYFEGRRITLRMDMPGTADGVDLPVDPPASIDYKKYRENLKRYGVALESGQSSTITEIKVKKDLIEFQIGGGGYGTFGDDTSTSSGIRLIDKSEREKELERRIKETTDRDRKRSLERELNELRDRRERENRRLRAESERIEQDKRERLAERRLHGGSRFNLRWANRVPPTIRPEDIEKTLVEYVDFRKGSAREADPPAPDVSQLRKGMLREDVEHMLGAPVQRSEKREGGEVVTTLVFDSGEQRVTAAFVEGVLVRYSISSK